MACSNPPCRTSTSFAHVANGSTSVGLYFKRRIRRWSKPPAQRGWLETKSASCWNSEQGIQRALRGLILHFHAKRRRSGVKSPPERHKSVYEHPTFSSPSSPRSAEISSGRTILVGGVNIPRPCRFCFGRRDALIMERRPRPLTFTTPSTN